MDPTYNARYARLYREHWWWRAREHLLQKLLDRVVGPGRAGDVLDFGCGDGLFFPVLELYGTPYGIEPNISLLAPDGRWRAAIRTDPLTFDQEDEGRYRLVVALDVLEHIQEPAPVIRELGRRLQPGGWFVATVPALQNLWTRHDALNDHFRRYSLRELETLVGEAGLIVVESRYFFFWLAAVKWIVGRFERLGKGVPKSPRLPWPPVNFAALALSRFEQAVTGNARIPLGSSALVLARKP